MLIWVHSNVSLNTFLFTLTKIISFFWGSKSTYHFSLKSLMSLRYLVFFYQTPSSLANFSKTPIFKLKIFFNWQVKGEREVSFSTTSPSVLYSQLPQNRQREAGSQPGGGRGGADSQGIQAPTTCQRSLCQFHFPRAVRKLIG